ncbi:MAG: HAMP domain-containing histidine kinase [Thermoplasmata archaeon]|nr:HAMP domain-containing histidine kinase [Thermoplasmata archaeon]
MADAPSPPSGEVDTNRRIRTLSKIFELTTELLHVEDMAIFHKRIAEAVKDQFGFGRVSISVADPGRGIFTDHAMAGYSPEEERDIRASIAAFEFDVILADFREDCKVSKIAYYIPAEKQESPASDFVGVKDGEAALKPRTSPDSWHELDLLYFALYDRRGNMIGYMQVDYPADNKIPTRQTIEEVELFAAIAAVGLENATMYRRSLMLLQENEVKTERILRILELIQSVLRIDDVDLVLQKVSDAMASTFGFRKAGVSLFSESSDRVTVHSLTGYSKEEEEAVRKSVILKHKVLEDIREEFRVTRHGFFIPGETQGTGADFVFVEDPAKIAKPRAGPDMWHELDLLYIGLIDREGRMLGYIQLDYPIDNRIPTKEAMETMEAFANIATIAIENSTIFKDLSDAKDQVRMYLDLLTHDVGNLANPVNAYLEIVLGTTSLTPVQHKYISSAQEASRSMIHLIRNVRRSAQMLESAENELVPSNLTKSLQQAAAEAKSAFLAKKVNVRMDFSSQDIWVIADTFLDEVIYNIFTNSIKYDEHEEIVIDVEMKPAELEGKHYIHLKIIDRGIGIPDDLKEKVFSREFRKMPRPERPAPLKAKGAGMGLSIVKALMNRYGGKIWVENRVYDDYTRGCVFNLLFQTP